MTFDFRLLRRTTAFTLVELMIAAVIFGLFMIVITSVSVNFYRGYKQQIARDLLYEETRVFLDRLAREARLNTIDFDEYFNHLTASEGGLLDESDPQDQYGQFYRQYFHQFFYMNPPADTCDADLTSSGKNQFNDPQRYLRTEDDPCVVSDINEGYFATRANDLVSDDNPRFCALGCPENAPDDADHEKEELYLINENGTQKTIITRIGPDKNQVGILQLDLVAADGYYSRWEENENFPAREFIAISPPSIRITNLQFFLNPIDDPKKAFAENDIRVRVHPHVTMVVTAELSEEVSATFRDMPVPNITLQTTVSSRVYENVRIPFEQPL